MDLKKKIRLGNNFTPPLELRFDDLLARPLTRNDLESDLKAVNSSIEIIRKTRGGSWPDKELSEDSDFLDLAWHEREFCENDSFAYVIYTDKNEYVGCFYLYPIGERTEFNEKTKDYDVDASWWVSEEMYNKGYYKKLQLALRHWLKNDFPFESVYYSNVEMSI